MEKRRTLEAVINIVWGFMGFLLFAWLGFVAIPNMGFMAITSCILQVVAPVIAILVIIPFVLEIIAGIGLLMRRGWAELWVEKLSNSPFWITL